MRFWWRVRAAPWLAVAVYVALAGALVFVGGLAAATLAADGERLRRAGEQAEVLGLALTVAGLAVSFGLHALRKLRGERAQLCPEEVLRHKVHDHEDDMLAALLDGRWALNSLLKYDNQDVEGTEHRVKKMTNLDLKGISDDFVGLETKRLVVLGQPGAGKTVLAIKLVLELLSKTEKGSGADALNGKIPVRFNAASWQPGQDFRQWLAERLVLDYGLAPVTARDMVGRRRVLPVVDGLDELDPELENAELADHCTPRRAIALLRHLNDYGELGAPAPVVVTCRTIRYTHLTDTGCALAHARTVIIRDLTTARLRSYLNERYANDSKNRNRWIEVVNRLGDPNALAARHVLATPWRLLLAVTAVDNGADPRRLLAAEIDENPDKAERRIVQMLLASYIPAATRLRKIGPSHKARYYDPEKVEHWMRSLAAHLNWQHDQARREDESIAGMTRIDIVPHLLWPIGGAKLIHRLHTALGMLAASAVGYAIFESGATHGLFEDILFYSVWLFIALYMVAHFAEPWPVPKLVTQSEAWRTLGGDLMGRDWRFALPVLGITYGIGVGIAFTQHYPGLGNSAKLASGAGFVFVALVVLVYNKVQRIGRHWSPDAPLASPLGALRKERKRGLIIGLVAGYLINVLAGPTVGLAAWVIIWLYMSVSSTRYIIGRTISAAKRRLPLRLSSFLTWACDSGLLRVSGATYQFRHIELQDWLHQPKL